MTRTEKYKELREMIERENEEHRREMAKVSFDDLFGESMQAFDKMIESFEVINDKSRNTRV